MHTVSSEWITSLHWSYASSACIFYEIKHNIGLQKLNCWINDFTLGPVEAKRIPKLTVGILLCLHPMCYGTPANVTSHNVFTYTQIYSINQLALLVQKGDLANIVLIVRKVKVIHQTLRFPKHKSDVSMYIFLWK